MRYTIKVRGGFEPEDVLEKALVTIRKSRDTNKGKLRDPI